jgi:hypothetical protein
MTSLIKLPMEPCFEFKFFREHMVVVVALRKTYPSCLLFNVLGSNPLGSNPLGNTSFLQFCGLITFSYEFQLKKLITKL